MYFAVYSLAASGTSGANLTGKAAASGMFNITYTASSTAKSFNMGIADITNIESALAAPGTPSISLNGTLGPPSFNQGTGARIGQGDVYCAAPPGAGSPGTFSYDVLTLAAADGGSPADGAALVGTFPCYDAMVPPP
jgi:hypothetical protein